MAFLLFLIRLLVTLLLIYLFLIAPNLLHRKISRKDLFPCDFAHRGLHDGNQAVPENSLAAFRAAVEKGYGIELDVHMTKDQYLVVHHDNSVKRLCEIDRKISEMTLEEVREFTLAGTQERIPTFDEVLELVDGRVPLLVELKSDQLGDTTVATLVNARMQSYKGAYCVESFDPMLLRWYKKHAPQVLRGQLAYDPGQTGEKKYKDFWHFAAAYLLMNFLSRPDFVSYGFKTDQNISYRVMRNVFRPMLAAWTVRSQEDYERLNQYYDWLIFESFIPQK